jgi:hypothetical protein
MIAGCTGDQSLNPELIPPEVIVNSAGILRNQWHHASRPAVIDTAISERGHIGWYNPYPQVRITEIWSNRDLGQGESDATHVLNIAFKPVDNKFIRDTVNNVIDSVSIPIDPENSWAGLMRTNTVHIYEPLIQWDANLEKFQFLEFRLRGDAGIMHIDIGRISEDIDGDGRLDNEDRDGYRILDDDEDVGLDLLPDSLEFGYDPGNGVIDPAGDDFYYDINNINVWRINGTEGNRHDPDGRFVPDVEDRDYNGMNLENSYFSYKINLSDTTDFYRGFYVDSTRNQYNWRTLRIPLHDPNALDHTVGSPSMSNCPHMRIWFDSASAQHMTDSISIQIASMYFFSTGWENTTYVADSLRGGEIRFDIAFVSDDTDTRYHPPPGIDRNYDPVMDVVTPSRSLLLNYEGFEKDIPIYTPDSGIVLAADTGRAARILDSPINLTDYHNLEAFVYGGVNPEDSVLFYFRMGSGEDVYYEYQTLLKPGWDPENYVFFDLIDMELMKIQFLEDRAAGLESSLIRQEGKYIIAIDENNRAPGIGDIRYFAMGIVNLDPDRTAGGEVWIYGPFQTGHRFHD